MNDMPCILPLQSWMPFSNLSLFKVLFQQRKNHLISKKIPWAGELSSILIWMCAMDNIRVGILLLQISQIPVFNQVPPLIDSPDNA